MGRWDFGGLLGSFWALTGEVKLVVGARLWRGSVRVLLSCGAVQLLAELSMAMELDKLLLEALVLQTRAEDIAVSSPAQTLGCRVGRFISRL